MINLFYIIQHLFDFFSWMDDWYFPTEWVTQSHMVSQTCYHYFFFIIILFFLNIAVQFIRHSKDIRHFSQWSQIETSFSSYIIDLSCQKFKPTDFVQKMLLRLLNFVILWTAEGLDLAINNRKMFATYVWIL